MVSLDRLLEKAAAKPRAEEIPPGLTLCLGTCSNPLYLSFETVSLLNIKNKGKNVLFDSFKTEAFSWWEIWSFMEFICFESPETVWF